MTDTFVALTVFLNQETAEYDTKEIISAIKMIKGVSEVEPHISTPEMKYAQHKARRDLIYQLKEVLAY